MAEQLVAGSEHLITGTIYDRNAAGTLEALDLTGATLSVRVRQSDGTVKAISGTPDGDQVTNTGVFTAQIGPTDLTVTGTAHIQAWVTQGGRTYKSSHVKRAILESFATP
jgi:hypothetical protein